jgi:hypothetical protein
MDWDLKEELKDCLVAAAPYGGPIGMLPLLLLHTVGSQGVVWVVLCQFSF